MVESADAWTAGWEEDAEVKRRAWAAMPPELLLAWLDDALEFAQAAGALAEDRRRRTTQAEAWATASPGKAEEA